MRLISFLLFLSASLSANTASYFSFGHVKPKNPAVIALMPKDIHFVAAGASMQVGTEYLGKTLMQTDNASAVLLRYGFKSDENNALFVALSQSVWAERKDAITTTIKSVQKGVMNGQFDYALAFNRELFYGFGIDYDVQNSFVANSFFGYIAGTFMPNAYETQMDYKIGVVSKQKMQIGAYLALEHHFSSFKVSAYRPTASVAVSSVVNETITAELALAYKAQHYALSSDTFLVSNYLPRSFSVHTTVQSRQNGVNIGVSYLYALDQALITGTKDRYFNRLEAYADWNVAKESLLFLKVGLEANELGVLKEQRITFSVMLQEEHQ